MYPRSSVTTTPEFPPLYLLSQRVLECHQIGNSMELGVDLRSCTRMKMRYQVAKVAKGYNVTTHRKMYAPLLEVAYSKY